MAVIDCAVAFINGDIFMLDGAEVLMYGCVVLIDVAVLIMVTMFYRCSCGFDK